MRDFHKPKFVLQTELFDIFNRVHCGLLLANLTCPDFIALTASSPYSMRISTKQVCKSACDIPGARLRISSTSRSSSDTPSAPPRERIRWPFSVSIFGPSVIIEGIAHPHLTSKRENPTMHRRHQKEDQAHADRSPTDRCHSESCATRPFDRTRQWAKSDRPE